MLCPALLLARSVFFFSSRRRHTRFDCDWSSDVCSSDLGSFLRTHAQQQFASLVFLDCFIIPPELLKKASEKEVHQWECGIESDGALILLQRSEERRVGKSVDLGGRRIIKKKKKKRQSSD